MRKIIIAILMVIAVLQLQAQTVYEHVSGKEVYDFIDELANLKIVVVNSAVKPYSKKFIGECLLEAEKEKGSLTKRQQKELEFYLRQYRKDLPIQYGQSTDIGIFHWGDEVYSKKKLDMFHYRDSLFSFTVNPIVGVHYLRNDSGSVYHRWNGLDGYATIGEHFGFYANLRDNFESEAFASQNYLNQQTGATFKGSGKQERQGVEYSDMRGGITYAWSWGTIGLIKDNVVWGNNYNGANILSGKTPSFAMLKLHLNPAKWIEFNYIHGWLVSEVIDSARSYYYFGNPREVFHDKYIAANLYTFRPFKNTAVSFGNSIIYSDLGVHPAYLIPFLFYKSVDHTYNSTSNWAGQNSQMFFDFSTRQLKYLHLYASLFVDEVYISKILDETDHSNFFSYKAGFRVSNLIPNFFLTAEYTANRPIVFEHYMPTTTFESNSYNLGHYLQQNAREMFLELKYKPISRLSVSLGMLYAEKGEDYQYAGGQAVRGLNLIESIKWKYNQADIRIFYQISNDIFTFFRYNMTEITGDDIDVYTPDYLHGKMRTIEIGVNWGF